MNFDFDHHVKAKGHAENEKSEAEICNAEKKTQQRNKQKNKLKEKKKKVSVKEDEVKEENQTILKALCFVNPPGKNLCFSNSAISCILNIPMMKLLFEIKEKEFHGNSVLEEIFSLSKSTNFSKSSTENIRNLVQKRCFEAGQWTKTFNDNRQHDTGEFILSFFEHLFNEEVIPISFREQLFGGLCQNVLQCKCGHTEEMQIQQMPAVLPIQLCDVNIQTCFESYFLSEDIDWKCPRCLESKVRKLSSLITEPEVLILQLMRYKYDDTQEKVRKIHNKVTSPQTLILPSGNRYSLHSVINHIGEDTQSGHYNVIMFEAETERIVLLDDTSISYIDHLEEEMKTTSYIFFYIAE